MTSALEGKGVCGEGGPSLQVENRTDKLRDLVEDKGGKGLGIHKSDHFEWKAPNHALTRAATLSTLSACLASAHPWTFRVATVRVRLVSVIFVSQMKSEVEMFTLTSVDC